MEGEAEEREASGLPEKRKLKEEAEESESEKEVEEEGRGVHIPLHRWVMHGSVMFGREFCYAMETALVAPLLLQIGKEMQYSHIWCIPSLLNCSHVSLTWDVSLHVHASTVGGKQGKRARVCLALLSLKQMFLWCHFLSVTRLPAHSVHLVVIGMGHRH